MRKRTLSLQFILSFFLVLTVLLAVNQHRATAYAAGDRIYYFNMQDGGLQGSMILDQPGQVSSPLRSTAGLHLVEYLKDVAPGDVPLEEVRAVIEAQALAVKQQDYYEEQVTAMLEDANVVYYPERLQ